MKYCPYCHNKLYENDDYCLQCGRLLKNKKSISRLECIDTKFVPNEFDLKKFTPQVKLSNDEPIETFSKHGRNDKFLDMLTNGKGFSNSKKSIQELEKLEAMKEAGKKQTIIAVLVILFLIIFIFSRRF